MKKIIYNIKYWLITRKYLWRKVVIDNGMLGENYKIYKHIILPYSYSAVGYFDNLNNIIDWQIYKLQKSI